MMDPDVLPGAKGRKWYACIDCSRVFDSRSKLDKHYSANSRRRGGCGTALASKRKVTRRRLCQDAAGAIDGVGSIEKTDHNMKPEEVYICKVCRTLVKSTDKNSHQKLHEVNISHDKTADLKTTICIENTQRFPYLKPTSVKLVDTMLTTDKCHPENSKAVGDLISQFKVTQLEECLRRRGLSMSDQGDEGIDCMPVTTGLSSKHFSKRNYEAQQVPWTFIVPRSGLEFLEQEKLSLSKCVINFDSAKNLQKSSSFPDFEQRSPAPGTPSSSCSQKENVHPVEINSSGYQERKNSSNQQMSAVSGSKLLCHLCFFCGNKFPQEDDYLIHIMHDHLKNMSETDMSKRARYAEILSSRIEITELSNVEQFKPKYLAVSSPKTSNALSGLNTLVNESAYEIASNDRLRVPELSLQDIGEKIFMECPMCSKTLAISNRISHMTAHLEDPGIAKALLCGICSHKSKNLAQLKDHISVHFRVKTFSCSYCWEGFSHQIGLQLHMKRIHKELFKSKLSKTRRLKSQRR